MFCVFSALEDTQASKLFKSSMEVAGSGGIPGTAVTDPVLVAFNSILKIPWLFNLQKWRISGNFSKCTFWKAKNESMNIVSSWLKLMSIFLFCSVRFPFFEFWISQPPDHMVVACLSVCHYFIQRQIEIKVLNQSMAVRPSYQIQIIWFFKWWRIRESICVLAWVTSFMT